jgi:hypothetical protein
VDDRTIRRDLSGAANAASENTPEATGVDGKTYPARQRTEAERQELVTKEQLSPNATIHNDLSTVQNRTVALPDRITGKDGKSRISLARCPTRPRQMRGGRTLVECNLVGVAV